MRFHDITKDDMKNGLGLRVVLWLSGCSHHCPKCQNPITWNPDIGIVFDNNAKKEIFEQLDKDYIDGITFSGGDQLYIGNRKEVLEFIKEIKEKYPNKTIWLYTGYSWEDIKDLELVKYLDVLIDGEFLIDEMDTNLHWVGSKNQKVIDVQKTLKNNKIITIE